MNKTRVGVIFGGRSGEHEVSVVSATSIIRNLDPARYVPVAIRIDKDGRWVLPATLPHATSAADVLEQGSTVPAVPIDPFAAVHRDRVDVVFPVLHGPYGEDGTVQGLLELAGVPYVGAGVLGSAVGMDKAVMKTLFAARGLPVAPYLAFLSREWTKDPAGLTDRVSHELGYPVFVKPANLGSSVGISKASTQGDLPGAVALAASFDRKIVIEAAVPRAREIECGVLGNDEAEASVPGEIVSSREFYDYHAKYLDDSVRLLVPAPLGASESATIQTLSLEAFKAVDGAGMCRVDFLINGDTGETFINEVNTIPGFTTVSMYPRMWEASGLAYPALLDRLIALALERYAERQSLRTSIA